VVDDIDSSETEIKSWDSMFSAVEDVKMAVGFLIWIPPKEEASHC